MVSLVPYYGASYKGLHGSISVLIAIINLRAGEAKSECVSSVFKATELVQQ